MRPLLFVPLLPLKILLLMVRWCQYNVTSHLDITYSGKGCKTPRYLPTITLTLIGLSNAAAKAIVRSHLRVTPVKAVKTRP